MSNPNFINVNSPTFRDFLLKMNLPLKDSITDNSLQSSLGTHDGIGKPVNIKYTNETPNGENLIVNGDYEREYVNIPTNKFQGTPDDYQLFSVDNNINTPQSVGTYDINNANANVFPALGDVVLGQNKTISAYLNKNLYYDPTQVVKVDLNQDNSIISNQFGSYLDKNGKLTFSDGINEPYGIVTSLLNGNGIGFGSNGLLTNGDIRNTLVGRALSSAGVIDDTPLGRIGAQQLAIQLGNNALFHLERETVGKLNTNVWSLFDNKDDSFLKPNYDITVPSGAFAKTVDFLADLGGFSLPKSQLDVGIFSFDDNFQYDGLANIERANEMLKNTGIGQATALFSNLNASILNISEEAKKAFRYGYAPNLFKGDEAVNDYRLYAYYDGQGNVIEGDGGKGPFYKWTDTEGSGFDAKINSKFVNDEGEETSFTWYGDRFNSNLNDEGKKSQDVVGLPPIGDYTFFPNRKSLLYKTKQLFLNNKIASLVTGHGILGDEDSEIQNVPKKFDVAVGLSKGSGVLSADIIRRGIGRDDKPEDIFCRTWSPNKQYNSVNDQIKSRKLDEDGGNYLRRDNRDLSVLENTGHVKIGNYKSDESGIKRYMFSIENLAYNPVNLRGCEVGPNNGRIMWFPPYDISFNESVSVSWDKTNFIGRGEPIYTYNNTERTGSLSFKVIVDHPNYMNSMISSLGNEVFASIAAGCIDNVSEFLTPLQREQITAATTPKQAPQVTVTDTKSLPSLTHIFFPNDVAESYFTPTYISYESGLYDYTTKNNISPFAIGAIEEFAISASISYKKWKDEFLIDYNTKTKKVKNSQNKLVDLDSQFGLSYGILKSDGIVDKEPTNHKDTTNYGLNGNRFDGNDNKSFTIPESNGFKPKKPNGKYYGWTDPQYFEDLANYLLVNTNVKITFIGYASKVGANDKNRTLSLRRAEATLKFFKEKLLGTKVYGIDNEYLDKRLKSIIDARGATDTFSQQYDNVGNKICNENQPWTLACKLNRRVQIKFEVDNQLLNYANVINTQTTTPPDQTDDKKELLNSIHQYTECDHFEKLKEEDKFIYNKLSDKIKYFSPSFHSVTPEGFNSRLTFLHQCTRQGETNYEESPTNLAFGKAPICILRIGDFFHTKIVIENMSIDYEPLVWDINPEGVGVQPMIANVTLNIALIGGSSLDGPINKLQNAVSYNFYANTEIYDTRADSLFNFKEADEKKKAAKKLKDEQDAQALAIANEEKNLQNLINNWGYTQTDDEKEKEKINNMTFEAVYNDGLFKNNVISTIKLKENLSKDYTVKISVTDSKTNENNRFAGISFVSDGLLTKDKKELKSESKNKVNGKPWTEFFDVFDLVKYVYAPNKNITPFINKKITSLVFKVDFILNDKLFFSKTFDYNWTSEYKGYRDLIGPLLENAVLDLSNISLNEYREIVGYKNGLDDVKKVIVTGELKAQTGDVKNEKKVVDDIKSATSTNPATSKNDTNESIETTKNKFTQLGNSNSKFGLGIGESAQEGEAIKIAMSKAKENYDTKNPNNTNVIIDSQKDKKVIKKDDNTYICFIINEYTNP